MVTGFQAWNPGAHGKRAAVPGCLVQGRLVGGARVPHQGQLSRKHNAPFSGSPSCCSHGAKAARKSVRCGVGDGSAGPHPRHPRKTGSGSPLLAQRTAGRGGRVPNPGYPSTINQALALDALLTPPQRAEPAPKSVCSGLLTGPHVRIPRAQRKRAVGSGCTPGGQPVGEGECPSPDPPTRRH